jgi:VWFA-related protein
MTTTRVLAVLALSCLINSSPAANGQDPAAPSAPGRLLEIQAVALDRDGTPVNDLRPTDLEVWIAGFRVPIESLLVAPPAAQDTPGRLIVLLMDDITLDPVIVARARDVANRFVAGLRPNDRMGVVMLNGGPMELTSAPARLSAQIDRFRQSLGALPVDQLGVQLLTRVTGIAGAISEAPERRKIIVAIGSAWLLDTPVLPGEIGGARNLRQEWFDAMRALGAADATYYVIDPVGVGRSRQTGSNGLAREAGGYAFTNTNDLKGPADRILREADSYYVIRVADPPAGRKALVREVDVRSLRRDLTVRARRGIPGGGGK